MYITLVPENYLNGASVRGTLRRNRGNNSIMQQAVALNASNTQLPLKFSLPWGYHIVILNKIKDLQVARF